MLVNDNARSCAIVEALKRSFETFYGSTKGDQIKQKYYQFWLYG